MTKQVQEWIGQGYGERQIALLYNHPASGGHTCSSGYNEAQRVKWDSCRYANNVLVALNH